MKIFAMNWTYVDNIFERRAPYRPDHLARLERLRSEGRVALAGAFVDLTEGGMIIFRADTPEEVERLVREDPYYKAGLITGYQIREWSVVIGSLN